MSVPAVKDFMSRFPVVVDRGATIADAHAIMRESDIRHLLVMDQGQLVGIVSDRDLHLIETLRGVDPHRVAVEEAMTQNPFTVRSDTPLEEAALAMTARKMGSVVVTEEGAVVGLLTTIDALRALVGLLRAKREGGVRKAAGRLESRKRSGSAERRAAPRKSGRTKKPRKR